MPARIPGRSTRIFEGQPYIYVFTCTSEAEAKGLAQSIRQKQDTLVQIAPDRIKEEWHVYKQVRPYLPEPEVRPNGYTRYYSEWYERTEKEFGTGVSALLRLGLIHAMTVLAGQLTLPETQVPTHLRVETEIAGDDFRVVLVAERKEEKQ